MIPRVPKDVPLIPLLYSLEDWANVSIIFLAIVMGTFLIIATVFAVIIGLLSRGILKRVTGLMDEDVKPILTSARDTAGTVKGTTQYVSESAVTPIVRAYGVVAGVRRAAVIIAGLTGFGEGKQDRPQG